jgi:simple sugar transport system substrate-binding protein
VLAAGVAVAASACSSSGGSSAATSSPGASASGVTTNSARVSIYAIGGEPSDPFWAKVKRGVEDAAKVVSAQGGSVTWLGLQNYNNLGPDAAKLVQTAISDGATAVIAPDWVPQAENSALKQVVAAHVPLIVYNSGGIQEASLLHALDYIGSDDYTAGVAGGKYFGAHGIKHVLCVNTLPGAANSEARCKGIKNGLASSGGKETELELPSSQFGNPTAVSQAIKAALLHDSSIDGVVTISVQDADSAASAISQASAGAKVKLGTFDVDSTNLGRIKAGQQLFCIDQQPYLQGFLSVTLADGYQRWGLTFPQKPLLTGPAIIDAGNIGAVLAGAKAGVR